ncbi:MAG: adenylate/guanylate cyclase domain-containing protein [Lachnospiraceae bacterium]|nr:adenylate/guanylate cyclase domain-containing protein [Lachnospiraceae bacterium]
MKKYKQYKSLLLSLLAVALVTLIISAFGGVQRMDRWLQDALFQSPKALDGTIIVIGIDDRALEEIGPYNTWDRSVMASALEALAADPDRRPAVVAIDTLYTGESSPEADMRLARAAENLGNVITASFASIGTAVVEGEGGNLMYDRNAVLGYSLPYNALKDVTVQGHINAMADEDGILRHALLTVSPDNADVYSMAFTAAKNYANKFGIEISEPPARDGNYYISYSALPGGFYDGYSISDLIDGKITPDDFEDKIVFIGPYAVGLQDTFFTAIDHGEQMYGVEYQANVTQMILDGEYKKEAGTLIQTIILFIVCVASFMIFQKTGIRISSAVAAVLIALGIGIPYILYGMGYVTHPLWIPAGVFVLYLISIGMRYARSVVEKLQLTRTFERYVAPEIVREILKEGEENLSLGGKLCDIAVLFVDIRGFTTMSEHLSPETVVRILNKYLTMASTCVEEHQGTLDKFVGDAMMAFWGAPLPQEDAVYNAVMTAMDIVKGAAQVCEELRDEVGEELNVGVGVHFGPAVVGNMGAERHMDYTAIGDTVNTAARLEANAPGGCIYISRAVADALGDRIRTESLGTTVKLKGKSEGFEVLKVVL